MKHQNALNFLKFLHTLEMELSTNVLTQIERELVASVRANFLKEYRGENED